jgi:hypothetical protein
MRLWNQTWAGGDDAPGPYRIATVRNIEARYAAFDVQPGQRLHLTPTARVHAWKSTPPVQRARVRIVTLDAPHRPACVQMR